MSFTPLSPVKEDPSHEPVPVLLEVATFDESGQSLHGARVPVPADDFEHGFYPGCLVGMMGWEPRVDGKYIVFPYPSGADAKAVERSMAVFNSLFRLANLELKPILDAVVAPPPIVKVLLHGGHIHLTTQVHILQETEPVIGLAGVSDPVYSSRSRSRPTTRQHCAGGFS